MLSSKTEVRLEREEHIDATGSGLALGVDGGFMGVYYVSVKISLKYYNKIFCYIKSFIK